MRKYVTFACLSIACICGVFFYSPVVYGLAGYTLDGTSYTVGDITIDTLIIGEYNSVSTHYDYTFQVTLTNMSDSYQVADSSSFTVYANNTDYSASSCRYSVTSYSDNVVSPYYSVSVGLYCHFSDASGKIVLAPGEIRVYSVSIATTSFSSNGCPNYASDNYTNNTLTLTEYPDSFTSYPPVSLPSAILYNHASGTVVNGVQVNRIISCMGYEVVDISSVWDPEVESFVERYLVRYPLSVYVSYNNTNDFRVSYSGVLTLPLHSASAYNHEFFVGADVSDFSSDFMLSDITGTVYTRNFHFVSTTEPFILTASAATRVSFTYNLYYSFTSLDTFTYVPSFYASPLNPSWVEYTTDVEDQMSGVHDQESTWFSDTNTAIDATALDEWYFDDNETSAYAGVRSQFGQVWRALGGWTNTYYFVLLIGLSMHILRHAPRRVKASSKSKEGS